MSAVVYDTLTLLSPGWLIPAVICFVLGLRNRQATRGAWKAVLSPEVYRFLGAADSAERSRWYWWVAAWVALALSAPAARISDASSWRHATAWIAIVDVSRSMTLEDIKPSRLAAARDTVIALSTLAGARPMALLIYAGDAFLVSPPAFDRSLLEQQASLLEHGSVPIEGSNLARALSLGASIVADSGLVAARVIVLGDTAGSNDNAVAAARYLNEQGHTVDVLLFADPNNDAGRAGDVDEAAAARLANHGGGRLLVADAFGSVDLDGLQLDTETDDVPGLQSVQWQPLSHWLLLPLLLVIPLLARERHSA